jgi:hypothetical protein
MSAPVIITPAAPIISAADAKLRQTDLAGATDAVVNAAIATATTALENYTGRAIGVQTLDWYPDETDSDVRMYLENARCRIISDWLLAMANLLFRSAAPSSRFRDEHQVPRCRSCRADVL